MVVINETITINNIINNSNVVNDIQRENTNQPMREKCVMKCINEMATI